MNSNVMRLVGWEAINYAQVTKEPLCCIGDPPSNGLSPAAAAEIARYDSDRIFIDAADVWYAQAMQIADYVRDGGVPRSPEHLAKWRLEHEQYYRYLIQAPERQLFGRSKCGRHRRGDYLSLSYIAAGWRDTHSGGRNPDNTHGERKSLTCYGKFFETVEQHGSSTITSGRTERCVRPATWRREGLCSAMHHTGYYCDEHAGLDDFIPGTRKELNNLPVREYR
jgi:hypothetical protein